MAQLPRVDPAAAQALIRGALAMFRSPALFTPRSPVLSSAGLASHAMRLPLVWTKLGLLPVWRRKKRKKRKSRRRRT
jgi:hypothetical protein